MTMTLSDEHGKVLLLILLILFIRMNVKLAHLCFQLQFVPN